MGIEWVRDLSVAVLGLVTLAVLVFMLAFVYYLYRKAKSARRPVKPDLAGQPGTEE